MVGFFMNIYIVGCIIASLLLYNQNPTDLRRVDYRHIIINSLGSWYTVYYLLK